MKTKNPNMMYDAIIIGAGGAGLMCALTAGQRNKRILVIDHAEKPGKKILISGGGRCNFTNLNVTASNFISQNPHFAKSALAQYTSTDFIDLVNKHGITWHEKTLGQLFCDHSAKLIVEMLMVECTKGGVQINLAEPIDTIACDNGVYGVKTAKDVYTAPSLVVATGGPSIPKLGASGFAYDLARQFRLKVVEPRPALVPLTLNKNEALFTELSGVATHTITGNHKARFQEASLFTHKGLSGPAVLQISSYWRHGENITINFLPGLLDDWLISQKSDNGRIRLKFTLSRILPERLVEALLEKLMIEDQRLAEFKDVELRDIVRLLQQWTFTPNGTEGFAKAEVTIGGVSTSELSSKTMETKKQKGLFFIGEAVDVTGWLGGYNFQWAWSSGFACGNHLGSLSIQKTI